jgi:hypothetical protein
MSVQYYKVQVLHNEAPVHTSIVRSKNKHSAVVNVLVNKYKGDFDRVAVAESNYAGFIEQRYMEVQAQQQLQD